MPLAPSLLPQLPTGPVARANSPLSSLPDSTINSNLSDSVLEKWQETAAMIIANRTVGDSAALTALGDALMANGWLDAAHVWCVLPTLDTLRRRLTCSSQLPPFAGYFPPRWRWHARDAHLPPRHDDAHDEQHRRHRPREHQAHRARRIRLLALAYRQGSGAFLGLPSSSGFPSASCNLPRRRRSRFAGAQVGCSRFPTPGFAH